MIYFIGEKYDHGGPVKIGLAQDPVARLAGLQTAHWRELEIIATMPGDQETERALHARFRAHRIRGEWFRCSEEIRSLIESCKHGTPRLEGSISPAPKPRWRAEWSLR